MICIFTYERPNLLRLCTDWLLESRLPGFHFAFFDDGSGKAVRDYLNEVYQRLGKDYCIKLDYSRHEGRRDSQHGKAMRLAVRRQQALDFAMAQGYDFVMLKDDDILTTCGAILEAIHDFKFLEATKYLNVGAYTMHGLATHGADMQITGKVFTELRITGEAHVLFSERSLMTVGNHFGEVTNGFADTQFDALRKGNWKYMTRRWPPYQVQHLGIGPNGSVIHEQTKMPKWVQQPYHCTHRRQGGGKTIQVDGFPIDTFAQVAAKLGGEVAAERYLTQPGVIK